MVQSLDMAAYAGGMEVLLVPVLVLAESLSESTGMGPQLSSETVPGTTTSSPPADCDIR